MSANAKLLRSNVTVLLAYPEAFANAATPTSAELNAQFDYTTNVNKMVFNISCALTDDGWTFNLTDSETDDTRTICDVAQVSTPTFKNYEVSFDSLRDLSVTANGVFNLAWNLTKGIDRPFWAIQRIGKTNSSPFAIGDDIRMLGVTTDNGQDIVDDKALIKWGARFKPTGQVLWNYTLAS
jgi:hypothetical protein